MKNLFIFLFAALVTVIGYADATKDGVGVQQKTMSIDLPDRSIKEALREVADFFEINVIIPNTLKGRTSIKLREVTWRQAFDVILKPMEYTYVEDGQIVKVIPIKPTTYNSSREAFEWLDGPWYVVAAAVGFGFVTLVCHLAFFIGVLRDAAVTTKFAPKFIWALFVLMGGILPLAGYWLIHHSSLRSQDKKA